MNGIKVFNLRDKNVIIITVFKLFLLILFSSEYSFLFYNFSNHFISDTLNPWQYNFDNNLGLEFPYHPLMLYILYPFSYIANITSFEFIFKLPLLLFDLMIYYTLLKLFPEKKQNIIIFYMLNPIIIYSIFIHSQLDIIPTALLIFSIYLLVRKKTILSSLIFGMALSTKLHILVALPLIVFYLYKTEKIKKVFSYPIVAIVILFFFDLPFLFSNGFVEMVLLNQKQSLVFDSFYSIGSARLLLPFVAIFSVYFHFFNQNKVNNDLLFFYFGLLFVATMFFIYSGPAWYVWMAPFIAIYFIKNRNKNRNKTMLLHIAFSTSYLLFFIFFYKSEYKDILFFGNVVDFKIHDENLSNLSFTLLEVILLAIMYAFYKYGIKSNSIYKKQTNLTIGIGGDSGVGKSRMLNNLQQLIGKEKFLQIEGDGEHKWERGNENWEKFTHLDPKANHLHKQANAIYTLKENKIIYRSEYDHIQGNFTTSKKIIPKKFIVIAGLHPFYLPRSRKIIDIKMYIDTQEELRQHWKIIRDTKQRGYSKDKVMEQIKQRMSDAKKYIYPQKNFADIIIRYFALTDFELGGNQQIRLGLKTTLDANIHIESILEKLNCEFTWDYNNDLRTQYVTLKEEPKEIFDNIAIKIIENIREILPENFKFQHGYEGFIQLISLKMISEKLKEEDKIA